jgi:VWFA-related protein
MRLELPNQRVLPLKRATVLLSITICLGIIVEGQWTQAPTSSAPTIRATAHLVAVDVVVTDKEDFPVHGLTADDFNVVEDHSAQKIESFEEHRGSAAMAEVVTATLQPGTYANHRLSSSEAPLCVILIDSLNTALSDQATAQAELLKLAQALPANSRIAVFRLGAKLSMLQGFTDDTAALVAMLKSKKGRPEMGPFFDDPDLQFALDAPDPGSLVPMLHTMRINVANANQLRSDLVVSQTLQALRTLGLYLSSLPGRKNLIWLSGAFPIDILLSSNDHPLIPPQGLGEADTRTYMEAIRNTALLLQTGNIVLYPVDLRGVVDNGLFAAARTGNAMASLDVAGATQAATGFALRNAEIHNTMKTMAALTGGRAFYNTNDISGSIIEAFNDGSNYYSFSYVPTDQNWNGRFRKISVQLFRKDCHLYYREGYYAEDPHKPGNGLPGPDPVMHTAMVRGTPELSGISFQLKVSPDGAVRTLANPVLQSRETPVAAQIKGPAQHYSITYVVTPSDIQFAPVGADKVRSNLAFSAIAYDNQGRMLNSNVGFFNAPITNKTYAAVMHDALHIQSGIDLPVGRIYLRVGVHDLNTGKIGAFEIPVEVGAANAQK